MNIELLEVLKESLINQKSITAVDIDIIDNAIKELKALEIIKKKGIYWGIGYQPYEEKNDYRAWDNELYESVKLSKEEYELLKEVLEK